MDDKVYNEIKRKADIQFKEYLQLSLFPDIVPHYKITNITNNGNNK